MSHYSNSCFALMHIQQAVLVLMYTQPAITAMACVNIVAVKKYLHLTLTKNDRKEYLYTQEFFFMPLH
jgi:hypothetical protein